MSGQGNKRDFEVVTTCSAKGWDEYGMRMVASFETYWPAIIPLRLYVEGFKPTGDYATVRDLPSWLYEFKAQHAKNPHAHGQPGRGGYNFRFDAIRFAHKTAAVIDTAERSEHDVLVWVDADTVTHSPVTIEFLRSLWPNTDQAISWLERTNKYPECGFYMLNLRHPQTAALIREWKELYTGGMLFHLPEWHDSAVLELLVKRMKLPHRNISGDGYTTGHPFINGPLGAVMDHMKGDRKSKGISRATDLKVARKEDYWKRVKR